MGGLCVCKYRSPCALPYAKSTFCETEMGLFRATTKYSNNDPNSQNSVTRIMSRQSRDAPMKVTMSSKVNQVIKKTWMTHRAHQTNFSLKLLAQLFVCGLRIGDCISPSIQESFHEADNFVNWQSYTNYVNDQD